MKLFWANAIYWANCSATFEPTPASAVTGISSAETGISDLIWSDEFTVVCLTDMGINHPNDIKVNTI